MKANEKLCRGARMFMESKIWEKIPYRYIVAMDNEDGTSNYISYNRTEKKEYVLRVHLGVRGFNGWMNDIFNYLPPAPEYFFATQDCIELIAAEKDSDFQDIKICKNIPEDKKLECSDDLGIYLFKRLVPFEFKYTLDDGEIKLLTEALELTEFLTQELKTKNPSQLGFVGEGPNDLLSKFPHFKKNKDGGFSMTIINAPTDAYYKEDSIHFTSEQMEKLQSAPKTKDVFLLRIDPYPAGICVVEWGYVFYPRILRSENISRDKVFEDWKCACPSSWMEEMAEHLVDFFQKRGVPYKIIYNDFTLPDILAELKNLGVIFEEVRRPSVNQTKTLRITVRKIDKD